MSRMPLQTMAVCLDVHTCTECGGDFDESEMAANHDAICRGCVDAVESRFERDFGCNCCGGSPCVYRRDR